MNTRRNRPITLTDAPEHRAIPIERVNLRDDSGDDNVLNLEGYASTFEPYDMYGGPDCGGWIERLDTGAFEKTLREKPDLHLLINHAGMPLARTKSGTLQLSTDEHGLKVTAQLDKRDPEVQALGIKMARGDMDEMSFAFRVKGQKWESLPEFEEPEALRTITEVSLHKGDVSVVNWGANPTTHAEVKSAIDALEVLANADASEFAEIRTDSDLLVRARIKLDELLGKSAEVEIGDDRSEEAPVETEETADERWARYAESIAAGLMTLNEVRELEGLIPEEERDEEEQDEREEDIEPEEREITVESILSDIEAAGLLDAFVEAFRELIGVKTEERDDEEESDESDDVESLEEKSDEVETEEAKGAMGLRLALALLDD